MPRLALVQIQNDHTSSFISFSCDSGEPDEYAVTVVAVRVLWLVARRPSLTDSAESEPVVRNDLLSLEDVSHACCCLGTAHLISMALPVLRRKEGHGKAWL